MKTEIPVSVKNRCEKILDEVYKYELDYDVAQKLLEREKEKYVDEIRLKDLSDSRGDLEFLHRNAYILKKDSQSLTTEEKKNLLLVKTLYNLATPKLYREEYFKQHPYDQVLKYVQDIIEKVEVEAKRFGEEKLLLRRISLNLGQSDIARLYQIFFDCGFMRSSRAQFALHFSRKDGKAVHPKFQNSLKHIESQSKNVYISEIQAAVKTL